MDDKARMALTEALEDTLAILKEIYQWNPQAIPTHITIRGETARVTVLYQLAQFALHHYGTQDTADSADK